MSASRSSNVSLYRARNDGGRRCTGCGRMHAGSNSECRDCWRLQNAPWEPEPSDALEGGEWVHVRGVQRWIPGAPRQEVDATTIVKVCDIPNIPAMLACPTCHAKADRGCTTTTGRHREPHSNRFLDRVCSCGKSLPAGKKLCPECRTSARRLTMREVKRKQRARARSAQETAGPCGRSLPVVGGCAHDGAKDATNKSALTKELQLRSGPSRPAKDTTDL